MTHRLFRHLSSPASTREAAIFIAVATTAPLVISLFVTPYVVSTVGLSAYGFWAITGGLMAWVGLLDVGIGGAVQQRIAASPRSAEEIGRWVGHRLQ